MRLAALAILGLFGLAGCRPIYGVRAAGALQRPTAPSCVVDAVRTAPGISLENLRERRREGGSIVEIRYLDETRDRSPGRLFLVTSPAGQHVVFSTTWVAGLGTGRGAADRISEIGRRVSAQCGIAPVTMPKDCEGSACWALDQGVNW